MQTILEGLDSFVDFFALYFQLKFVEYFIGIKRARNDVIGICALKLYVEVIDKMYFEIVLYTCNIYIYIYIQTHIHIYSSVNRNDLSNYPNFNLVPDFICSFQQIGTLYFVQC